MGAHAEWVENLVADIDSMCQIRQEDNGLRKVLVSELLSDARDLVTQFHKGHAEMAKRHAEMAEELRESMGQFGADVREAAEIWQNRTAHSRRERTRPEEEPGEPQVKREKKKGKHG